MSLWSLQDGKPLQCDMVTSSLVEGMEVFIWDQTGSNTSIIVLVSCYNNKDLKK